MCDFLTHTIGGKTVMKKLLSMLLSAALLVSLLAGCSGSTDEEEEKEKEVDKGAEINMYVGERPSDLDPGKLIFNSDAWQYMSLIYEGLFTLDSNGKAVAAVADEWESEVDERDGKLKLYITLRSSRWSDGIPVDADDFIFAWKRILQPSNNNPAAALLYPIENARKVKSGEVTVADLGVTAVTDKILEVVFEDGFTDVNYFIETLASPVLVPLREDKVKTDTWAQASTTICTNGPFAVKTFGVDSMILERSTNYNALRTREKLTKYVVPYRITVNFDGGSDGQLEAYNTTPEEPVDTLFYLGAFSKEGYETVSSQKGFTTNDALTTYTYFFNTNNDVLADAAVRNALGTSLDRNEIAAIVGRGAKPATGIVPYGVNGSGYGKSFRSEAGDVISATAADAAKGKGSFTLTYNADRDYEKEIAEYAQGVWKNLGYSVKLIPVTSAEIINIVNTGDFDAIAMDYMCVTGDASSMLYPFATEYSGHTVDVTNPDVFFTPHFTGYESAEYNAVIETLYAAKSTAERFEALKGAEKIIVNDAPIVPLFFKSVSYIAKKDLSKISSTFFGAKDFRKTKLAKYDLYKEVEEETEEETDTADEASDEKAE